MDLKPLWVKFLRKKFWTAKNFRALFSEKIGKKIVKNGKNGVFEALRRINMCITSQNHIILLWNGEFCDDIAILGTKNNILVGF